MKVFRDISSNSGHFSIQNSFKAVIKYGAAIMNGRQDWALHELNMDADDWDWLHNRAEVLTIPVIYELAEARLH